MSTFVHLITELAEQPRLLKLYRGKIQRACVLDDKSERLHFASTFTSSFHVLSMCCACYKYLFVVQEESPDFWRWDSKGRTRAQ